MRLELRGTSQNRERERKRRKTEGGKAARAKRGGEGEGDSGVEEAEGTDSGFFSANRLLN